MCYWYYFIKSVCNIYVGIYIFVKCWVSVYMYSLVEVVIDMIIYNRVWYIYDKINVWFIIWINRDWKCDEMIKLI